MVRSLSALWGAVPVPHHARCLEIEAEREQGHGSAVRVVHFAVLQMAEVPQISARPPSLLRWASWGVLKAEGAQRASSA